MELNESLKSYNSRVKDRLISFKVGDFIGKVDLYNYNLAEFINVFKIKRMTETGAIDEDTEKYLLKSIRKYSTKVSEAVAYAGNEKLVDQTTNELVGIRKRLADYGIDPNPENIIKLENIISYDIYRKSIFYTSHDDTSIYTQQQMQEFSNQFLTRVLKLTKKDMDNLKLYNATKLEALTLQKYLNSNYKEYTMELYEKCLRTQDEEIKKELSGDPYNFVFDALDFDFTEFIDYLIRKEAFIHFGDNRGTYETKLPSSVR